MSLHEVTSKPQVDIDRSLVVESAQMEKADNPNTLFELYEKVVEARPGSRDAEIFEKVRQWTFSDFSSTAHEFAGVSKSELDAWQTRHRINLSAGHIRPDPIDLQRGYAWGHMRMAAAANRLHSDRPPPSAHEVKQSWLADSR
jgi:hypothetical protein